MVKFQNPEEEARMRAKMESYIGKGQARAQSVVARVVEDSPVDAVVRRRGLSFTRVGSVVQMKVGGTIGSVTLHENAIEQLCGRMRLAGGADAEAEERGADDAPEKFAGLPAAYAKRLPAAGEWGADLLAENLNVLVQHAAEPEQRFLVRSVRGQARAVLSDRFRRIDSRPIVDGLLGLARDENLVPSDGLASDTKVSLKFIRPEVLQPLPGEFVVFGFDWRNSDFGRGYNQLQSFLFRLKCLNGASVEQALRQVHLGSRLSEQIEYSQRTYQLDTRATLSAVLDTARHLVSESRIEAYQGWIARNGSQEIDVRSRLKGLRTLLTKGEAQEIADVYNGPDVEMLPPGNTAWRLSNAISFLANKQEDAEKRMKFEALAGSVLDTAEIPAAIGAKP